MAKKKPEGAPADPAIVEELQAGDGPVAIDPVLPPGAEVEPPKKKRGRPPGSGSKQKAAKAEPVIELEDVKRELAQASALAVAFTRAEDGEKPAGVLGELADSLGWHQLVKVRDETGKMIDAVAPSPRVEKATALMGPYLAESGALQLVQLSPTTKFVVGLGILVGPTLLMGFEKLWGWAMHPPKAAAQVVEMTRPKKEA